MLFCLLAPAVAANADLPGDIRTALASKSLGNAQVGVEVVRLNPDPAQTTVVFASRANEPMIPASNMKLLTTSAALHALGGDFRFTTRLAMRDDQLVIIGDGDPTIGDAEMLRRHGWTTTTLFENWAELLKSRGITRVGDVVVDDGVFDEQFIHPTWPPEQIQRRYVAQVAGLNLNANCLDFFLTTGQRGSVVSYRTDPPSAYADIANTCTFGQRNAIWLSRVAGGNKIVLRGETNASNHGEPLSVTIHDPPLYFGTVLAETLKRHGVDVRGRVVRDRNAHKSDGLTLLAQHETPIDVVLHRANKDSMNLYAEVLLKRLAAAQSASRGGSWGAGAAAVAAFLKERGVEEQQFSLADGSGLSKSNRVSAHAINAVLIADFYGPNREMFIRSLAVGGVDGTLDNRFGGGLKGRVFAKSGYVSNARCLSGFVRTKKDNWYAFSILFNGSTGPEAKRVHEAIVTAIDAND
ncbi:MAG TPA: D-alanyl-D-alanine carboxypeptidase/D-alanyl-D-alanine-endopeptidase [Tepidisphaeraceae bacterium]|nr:D-alanyl-D-alanine carboxypeptidase/D-alanyl-D-alanine-endopeptidase [Tepidisphaeraceae bacterium]